ncbi:unnamed protein product [Notodromas monacha]|uniref:Ras-related protein Rab-24 n=1 Tax=Notodromas monacha TaxID=399045 RepID=A0A7R9BG13_9CRUS|nr:unnamed protein product [Notodromas monacha]CAG0914069.1 unnamed protein product [Notodromas monacha]
MELINPTSVFNADIFSSVLVMSQVDVKVVLLGSSGCGKTSLVERFLHDRFEERYMPTIGAAFGAKRVKALGKILKLGIWDTAGQERYKAMSRIYYRGAKAAIVCYDLTDADSFREAQFWAQELLKQEDACKIYLCGTKADLTRGPEGGRNRRVDFYAPTDFTDDVNAGKRRKPHDSEELFQAIADDFISNPVNEPIVQELPSIHVGKDQPRPSGTWSSVCCSY